jgi:hypothetical protein
LRAIALHQTIKAVGDGRGPTGELDDAQCGTATHVLRRAAAVDPSPAGAPAAWPVAPWASLPTTSLRAGGSTSANSKEAVPPAAPAGHLVYWASALAGLSRRAAGAGGDGSDSSIASAAAESYVRQFALEAGTAGSDGAAREVAERVRRRFAVLRPRLPPTGADDAPIRGPASLLPHSPSDPLYATCHATLVAAIDAAPWPKKGSAVRQSLLIGGGGAAPSDASTGGSRSVIGRAVASSIPASVAAAAPAVAWWIAGGSGRGAGTTMAMTAAAAAPAASMWDAPTDVLQSLPTGRQPRWAPRASSCCPPRHP